MNRIILPGSVIGVLGSGQLGRMFAIAARRMGYRVRVLSPDDDTPTGQIADVEVQTDYEDLDAVARFARGVDVMTFEFENVPVATAEVADRYVPVRPTGKVLHTTQNRLREKTFLRNAGLPVTPFAPVHTSEGLQEAVAAVGLPAVLKTASWGYDGRGQACVESDEQAATAWQSLGGGEAVLERWVDFESELSVVAVRSIGGEVVCFDPITNTHQHHILDMSVAPATVSPPTAAAAVEIARTVLSELQVVGVLCVELFVTRTGELLINELAPRPHNSGHLTINAHASCQFEQQVRAVCGLPLASVEQLRPAAMVNLLGDLWSAGEPNWARACASPDVKLHLYGKREARPGRKMGHLTVLADDTATAARVALQARQSLTHPPAAPTDTQPS
jgi:5-(carboxyamino)imidazole ribonucleotide synthase